MESISRVSGILDTSHSLTLDAARSATSTRTKPLPNTATPSPALLASLKKQLDSKHEREILEGLRRVIALSHRFSSVTSNNGTGAPSSSAPLLLPHVLKNIANPSLAVKKLVYIHLLHSAEADPDTALLSINAIQKSLSAPDARLRALALRVMSGLRVPVISQIVALGIKRGISDPSALVRRAAALAIPKCWRLDSSTVPQLTEYLAQLLRDRQYYVAGAAVIAMGEVCPERIDLVHKQYRALVRKLVDMDEWAQLATLRLLTVYARKCFPRRTKRVRRKVQRSGNTAEDFYSDAQDGPEDSVDTSDDTKWETIAVTDPDLELLLKATQNLLYSRSSAVVVAVARAYVALAPLDSPYLDSAVGPLVALLRAPPDIQQIALHNIVQIALLRPVSFVRYATRFLIHTSDQPQIWTLKLDLLTLIFPHCSGHLQSLILNDLAHFSESSTPSLIQECVRAIGRCAENCQPSSTTFDRCLRLLLEQISSPNGELVAESLTVLRHLIMADASKHTKTVVQLAKNLDTMTNTHARASVIWLVGEMSCLNNGNNIAADVLRILAKGFADEGEPAKMQIILLAAKVYLQHLNQNQPVNQEDKPTPDDERGFAEDHNESSSKSTHQIELLWQYILLLARYDTSYDLRDRARVYKALLAVPSAIQLANLMLQAPKPVPHTSSPSESRKGFTLGSASLVIGHDGVGPTGLQGYIDLPDWVEEGQEPDPKLRDDASAITSHQSGSAAGKLSLMANQEASATDKGGINGSQRYVAEKSLDDWLAETDESETDGDEDESEESSDEVSTEESEEETEEEEESESDAGERDTLFKQG